VHKSRRSAVGKKKNFPIPTRQSTTPTFGCAGIAQLDFQILLQIDCA
jgi:hypothetical protein